MINRLAQIDDEDFHSNLLKEISLHRSQSSPVGSSPCDEADKGSDKLVSSVKTGGGDADSNLNDSMSNPEEVTYCYNCDTLKDLTHKCVHKIESIEAAHESLSRI